MFKPNYKITPQIAKSLMQIESFKKEISGLPLTPFVIATLQETARLNSVHYSTYIEGNRLTIEQVEKILTRGGKFPGKEHDAKEILGYYAALDFVLQITNKKPSITEALIQKIHTIVMSGGEKGTKLIPYRDCQNVIKDTVTRSIVYLPPEAKDVPVLMKDFILWLWKEKDILPCPILSGIAHYQFVTIHPYIDGNGRTARLLATLIFHLGGYGLKGVYSLEEYYAQDLKSYYNALSIGPSHNYYMGRETADITPWLEYFCTGVEKSFENIIKRIHKETTKETPDQSKTINLLDQKQRAILTLFKKRQIIKTEDIKNHFGIPDRTARWLCLSWVKSGFLKMADKSKKKRAYMLDPSLQQMIIKK